VRDRKGASLEAVTQWRNGTEGRKRTRTLIEPDPVGAFFWRRLGHSQSILLKLFLEQGVGKHDHHYQQTP